MTRLDHVNAAVRLASTGPEHLVLQPPHRLSPLLTTIVLSVAAWGISPVCRRAVEVEGTSYQGLQKHIPEPRQFLSPRRGGLRERLLRGAPRGG